MKIVVGTEDGSDDNRSKYRVYVLPQALLAHHSPFLEAECKRITADPSVSHIAFADVSPAVFALFIEWMCKHC
jgi:hypothetical protein